MKQPTALAGSILVLLLLLLLPKPAALAEWKLQWSVELPEREAAWAFTQRMGRDTGYAPVAGGDLVFVGCEHNGALLALDASSGKKSWRAYTEAPIRHAPAASADRVFVGSDDGYLRCFDHEGKLIWKRLGGPSRRLVIGHDRLMSAWPISTSPLLADGVLYFVAGYWPVDGIYVHAVDAETGTVIWRTNAPAFRPNRKIHRLGELLYLEGDNGKALLDVRTGNLITEKVDKPKGVERPELKGLEGTLTGWDEAADFLVAGSEKGVSGFAKETPDSVISHSLSDEPPPIEPIRPNGIEPGFCLINGIENLSLIEGLLQNADLSIVVVETDEAKAEAGRRSLDDRGAFESHRLAVFSGDPELPPYFASTIISDEPIANCLHPYRGVRLTKDALAIAERGSPPDGAADWTHEFQNAANTLASSDSLVRAPLGLLWYGGEAADARFYFDGKVDHQSGHGLNPQPVPANIVEGRMILQSQGRLAAVDCYTGRVLWEAALPAFYTFGGSGGGLGIHSKKHPEPWKHEEALAFPVTPTERCRASGFNMVSLPDGIYLCAARELLRFDPATGAQVSAWKTPDDHLRWGGIRAVDQFLVATAFDPKDLADAKAGHDGNGGDWSGDRMPMSRLIVLDRHSGDVIWERQAQWGFLNRSGIAASDDTVFCVDLVTSKIKDRLAEAGRKFPATPPTLHALDLETGKQRWQFPLDVYVQNIVYSAEHDLLLAPCRNLMEWQDGTWVDLSIDVRRGKRNKNAAGRMRAFRGKNGEVVWDHSEAAYHSPHIVMDDLIIDRWGHSYELLTGKRHERLSPLTGTPETWSFRKSGCNHLVAAPGLVTFRCAIYDLDSQGGVQQLTGMDAGCSPTLLPAGGILNIPNFGTHHKRNRMTAMALVHRSDNVQWTNFSTSREKVEAPAEPDWIQHAGFNFGAPGDRIDENGVLWLQVSQQNRGHVSFEPKQEVGWLNLGSIGGKSPVLSSAILGATEIRIPLTRHAKLPANAISNYTVRLWFPDPQVTGDDSTDFAVKVEGKTISPKPVGLVEIPDLEITGSLDIQLEEKTGTAALSGVELIRKPERKH